MNKNVGMVLVLREVLLSGRCESDGLCKVQVIGVTAVLGNRRPSSTVQCVYSRINFTFF